LSRPFAQAVSFGACREGLATSFWFGNEKTGPPDRCQQVMQQQQVWMRPVIMGRLLPCRRRFAKPLVAAR
jgi:hypothetical protein